MNPSDLQQKADDQAKVVSDIKNDITQKEIDIRNRQNELEKTKQSYNQAVQLQSQLEKDATTAKVAQKTYYGLGGDPNSPKPPAPPVI